MSWGGPIVAPAAEFPAPPRQVALPQPPPPRARSQDPPHLRQVLVRHGEDDPTEGDLASRLRASKPVTWRGRGDLAQVPWAPTVRGTWLVLDLWAGFSGLCIALLQMGLHFYGVAAECDEIACQVAGTNMPNLVHVPLVRTPGSCSLCTFVEAEDVPWGHHGWR